MDKAARTTPCGLKYASGGHTFDILTLINSFHAWYARVLGGGNLRLTTQISSEIPRHFVGNQLLIKHLLFETGKNTLPFIDKGKVHLEIEAEQPAGRCYTICITITLIGSSMSLNQEKQLFQSVAAQHDWQGLTLRCTNLYYARMIARGLGGDIRVLNDIGFGTRYRIEIQLFQKAV